MGWYVEISTADDDIDDGEDVTQGMDKRNDDAWQLYAKGLKADGCWRNWEDLGTERCSGSDVAEVGARGVIMMTGG